VNAPANCAALPLNQCGSRTECTTCFGSTLNSSTTLECGWCETTTTATCIPSSRCGNTGGTVAQDCASANPCIGQASCTECFAAGTCSWCEGDTDSVCVLDDGQTQCPGGGYQNITDCANVSPCFSHTGCTACNGEPAGCDWCQDFFTQAQSCVINCQGPPAACPTGASPQQAPAKAPVIVTAPSPATVVPSPMVVTVPNPAITNAPSDQSTTAAPSVQSTTAAPSVQSTTAAPSVQSTTAAPSDQSTTAAPSAQTTAAPSAQSTGASPQSVTTTSTTGISPSKPTIAPTPRATSTTVGPPQNTYATTVAFSLALIVIAALVSL